MALVSGFGIRDRFQYCNEIRSFDSSKQIVNLETECNQYKSIDLSYVNPIRGKIKDVIGTYENINELIANVTPRNSEYTIIQMLPFQVRGEGYECSKMLIKSISSVNLFGARSLDIDKKYVKLSREECKVLVKTRKCENREMHCDISGRECTHDGTNL